MEVDLDTSILIYGYKYHFHLVNQMYGTEGIFDTCILFRMFIEIMQLGPNNLKTMPKFNLTRDWSIIFYA